MKIAFGPQVFSWQKYGGISRYFTELVAQLTEMQDVETKIFAPLYVNEYVRHLAPSSVQGCHIPSSIPIIGTDICQTANRIFAPLLIRQFQPDIVHSTYYFPYMAAPKKAVHVITVYDMIHERFPSSFPDGDKTAARKKKAVLDADHVICISENTRRDLSELCELHPNKVSVVHLGYNMPSADSAVRNPVSDNSVPFLLYVGPRSGYKNFETFLRAYAGSEWLRENFRIICFGGGRFVSDESDLIIELCIKPHRIEQIDGGDNVLAAYYRNAAAFVYPSLYEGFGIPPLEAMASGCPVICSNTGSIPEIVGDAGEYFDPEQVESIRASLEYVLRSDERRAELVRTGFVKCSEYSWARCANETLAIYRKIIR